MQQGREAKPSRARSSTRGAGRRRGAQSPAPLALRILLVPGVAVPESAPCPGIKPPEISDWHCNLEFCKIPNPTPALPTSREEISRKKHE